MISPPNSQPHAAASGALLPSSDGSNRSDSADLSEQSVQCTLAHSVEQTGIGLHSGVSVIVRIHPAAPHAGYCFRRVDLPNAPCIPATIEAVDQTTLSTELRAGEATVRTVEHVLAALLGVGIDNALIEIDGPELPLLDGSALPWVDAIQHAGVVPQAVARSTITLHAPFWYQKGDAFVAALPAPELRFSYGIDFAEQAIGNQWHSWSPQQAPFATAIAPARTFALARQIDHLRTLGLIKGGTLENALVCDGDQWVNPPVRFANEPARHKLLDLIGDLSLLGGLPQAHFLAYKASHQLHTQFAAQLKPHLSYSG